MPEYNKKVMPDSKVEHHHDPRVVDERWLRSGRRLLGGLLFLLLLIYRAQLIGPLLGYLSLLI